jgi:exonuclease III
MSELTLATWNVNGLRGIVSSTKGGLRQFLESCAAGDILIAGSCNMDLRHLQTVMVAAVGVQQYAPLPKVM